MSTRTTGLTQALRVTALAAAVALATGSAFAAAPATAFPVKGMPAARDIGRATQPIAVTVVLKSRDEAGLARLAAELYTPGHAHFHQFLTPAQFHDRFDPSAATVAAARAYFGQFGLSVQQKGLMLEVSGPAAGHEKAFGVTLRQYEVPAVGSRAALRFHAASGEARIASTGLAAQVESVVGLDGHPHFAPNVHMAPATLPRQKQATAPRTTDGLAAPGLWTVKDLAAYYNVNPLYDAGYRGEGRTIGIVTLASFTPSDVFQYWADTGLTVDANRLRVVDVDGGPGAPSDASGSVETTLDVQQSGGLAPAANIVVYQAPNTDKAFLHAFLHAVEENVADSISVSWGSFEWFDTLTRPHGRFGQLTYLKAFDKVFVQAAMQGQSLFAAQGDAGAYEANRALPVWQGYAPVLSVGAPAGSPWITSAGGTTLPGTQIYNVGGMPFPVTIAHEQAWGWSYLTGLCSALGYDPVSCGIFPAGGGGGVSSFHKRPGYQDRLEGMRVTEAGQSVTDGVTDYLDLPAAYAGRNVPDISLNADPQTGYLIEYTSDASGFGVSAYGGGTSFVAPQLNGITALLGQRVGGRVGLLNFPMYAMARNKVQYWGAKPSFNDIKFGDNWFYTGTPGYDQATGIGTLNVSNFAEHLARHVGTASTK